MPAVQSTYNETIQEAFEGMIANTEPNNLISRQVEGGPLDFGQVAAQGSGEGLVTPASDAADIVRGVAVRTYSAINSAYVDGDDALLMTRGVVWVRTGAAVEEGADVYVVPATGRFTSVATDNLAIPRAIFDSSAADGDLVKIRLQ